MVNSPEGTDAPEHGDAESAQGRLGLRARLGALHAAHGTDERNRWRREVIKRLPAGSKKRLLHEICDSYHSEVRDVLRGVKSRGRSAAALLLLYALAFCAGFGRVAYDLWGIRPAFDGATLCAVTGVSALLLLLVFYAFTRVGAWNGLIVAAGAAYVVSIVFITGAFSGETGTLSAVRSAALGAGLGFVSALYAIPALVLYRFTPRAWVPEILRTRHPAVYAAVRLTDTVLLANENSRSWASQEVREEIARIRREVGDVIERAVAAPALAGDAADAERNRVRARGIASSVRSSERFAAPDGGGLPEFTAETLAWVESAWRGNWGAVAHTPQTLGPWLSRWPGILIGLPLLVVGFAAVRRAYGYASAHPEAPYREVVDATFGFALLLPVFVTVLWLLGNQFIPGWQDTLKGVSAWIKGFRPGGK
jgi:hypothetical protein